MKHLSSLLLIGFLLMGSCAATEPLKEAFAGLQQAQIELLYAENTHQLQKIELMQEVSPLPFFVSIMQGVLAGFGVAMSSLSLFKFIRI